MQKGFTPILILVGIVVLGVVAGGAYYLGKLSIKPGNKEPVFCTQDAKQCPDGSYVSRAGPNCEFAQCPDAAPKASEETANWEVYTNSEFGYSVKYFTSLVPQEQQRDDISLAVTSFAPKNNDDKDWFTVQVRKSLLDEEIKYQKSQIEGHVSVQLTKEARVAIEGFSGVLLEYTPDQPTSGSVTRFVIVNNGKYSYIISGLPQTLDQILSTFKFLPAPAGKDQKQDNLEGQFCGGFTGELCPEGYACKLEGDYPDAGGKCVKV